ncbi:MAG TPA: hypothetical protein VF529_12855 [Solirubrobacteraceae bacterium]|jgi:FKBP-type peptidyl-prolyl cis-trans isomerase
MAKQSRTDELFEMLRARGLRKQVARALSDATNAGRSGAAQSQKAALGIVADLRKLADEIEERLRGTSSSRSQAAKKAANTRARKATARSTAAKKAAATRKAKSATSRSSSSRSTSRGSSSSGGTRRRSTAKKS